MRFLFVSEDLIAGNIACLLEKEGHEVKLCILEEGRENNLSGLVEKVSSWERELGWVGKDGVIIFDYVGDGKTQDSLREQGYIVFGGGRRGEALELDRTHAQEIFSEYDINIAPIYDFTDIELAIEHVRNNPSAWVIKKNDIASNSVSYVGMLDSGRDTIDVLNSYKKFNSANAKKVSLQKRINGVELAVSRFFNGRQWVSNIELNIEHNPFMPGDIGLSTSEMGTIAWRTNNEDDPLFCATLKKLEPYLRSIDYRGVIDMNCIVNEQGIFPLEITARFGSPIVHLQSEMLTSGWGDLIYSCAKSEDYSSSWKNGYGIVVFVTTPPFPYVKQLDEYNPMDQEIYFENDERVPDEHVHFEDVKFDPVNNKYTISDTRGYILYITACEGTMKQAQELVYERLKKIHLPKMMYRNDIGTKFIENDEAQLFKLGYL